MSYFADRFFFLKVRNGTRDLFIVAAGTVCYKEFRLE